MRYVQRNCKFAPNREATPESRGKHLPCMFSGRIERAGVKLFFGPQECRLPRVGVSRFVRQRNGCIFPANSGPASFRASQGASPRGRPFCAQRGRAVGNSAEHRTQGPERAECRREHGRQRRRIERARRRFHAELCEFDSVGDAKACTILSALELGKRALALRKDNRVRIGSPLDVYNLLGTEMAFLDQESLKVLLLNTKNEVLSVIEVYKGTVDSSLVRVSEVLRPAIRENCPSIIIVHNHPSGDPAPSGEDIAITRRIKEGGGHHGHQAPGPHSDRHGHVCEHEGQRSGIRLDRTYG